jgi:hypothetical protein
MIKKNSQKLPVSNKATLKPFLASSEPAKEAPGPAPTIT